MAKAKKKSDKYEEIREILLQRKDEILTKGEGATDEEVEGEGVVMDSVDEANTTLTSYFNKRVAERELKLLKKIDEAIDSIEKGIYGNCKGCGKEINFERLKARPVATLCIECKTKQERDEKRRKSMQ